VVAIVFFFLCRYSFCDACGALAFVVRNTHWSEGEKQSFRNNLSALACSFVVLGIHYALVVLVIVVVYFPRGYNWGFTIWTVLFQVFVWIAAAATCVTLLRCTWFCYSFWDLPKTATRIRCTMQHMLFFLGIPMTCKASVFDPLSDVKTKQRSFVHRYLFGFYFSFSAMLALAIVQCFQSAYGFVIPPFFRVGFISSTTWDMRVQVITMQIVTMVVVIAALLQLCYLLLEFLCRSASGNCEFDGIYKMGCYKKERRTLLNCICRKEGTNLRTTGEEETEMEPFTTKEEEEEDHEWRYPSSKFFLRDRWKETQHCHTLFLSE